MDKDNEKYIYFVVGANLKRIRKAKGWTQEELASKTTYSAGFIMNIESKKYLQTFSLGTLWQFANALEVDIKEFFEPIDEN